MEKYDKANQKLDDALAAIDEACSLLIQIGSTSEKPKIKQLGKAVGEVLHVQKKIRDDLKNG